MSDSTLTLPDLAGVPAIEVSDHPIRIGSEAHKNLFCRTLLESFNPYKPSVIDWPRVDDAARDRLVALPIWDIAVQTENRAGLNVCTYGETVSDPVLKSAIELMGFEERRHRHVLGNLVEAYGIKLAPEPAYDKPKDREWAFLVTGYSECIDSFFAFGLFEIARRSGFFPEALVETFEPVIHEEGRHILFFINWAAWHRRRLRLWQRCRFELRVLAVWAFLIGERIGIATSMGGPAQDSNFTVTGAQHVGSPVTLGQLFDICLAENDRRMSGYDDRLVRPRLVPTFARLFRKFTRSRAAR